MSALEAVTLLNVLDLVTLPSAKDVNDSYEKYSKAYSKLIMQFFDAEYYDSSKPSHEPVELDTFVLVSHLRKFNEEDLSLTMEATLSIMWEDKRVVWDPRDFAGITTLHVKEHDIHAFWVPPVEIKAILPSKKAVLNPYNTEIIATSRGRMISSSKVSVKMACESDLSHYPYDHPNCSMYLVFRYMKFGSFVFGEGHSLMNMGDVVAEINATRHPAYQIVNLTATRYYITGRGPVTELKKAENQKPSFDVYGTFVQYQFTLQRNLTTYVFNILMPLFCSTILSLVGASLTNFHNSLVVLLCSSMAQVMNLIRIAASLPPNYEVTPTAMTYAIFLFVEIQLFVIYKIGLAWWLKSDKLKPKELSKLQLTNRLFLYYLLIHALVSYWFLFF